MLGQPIRRHIRVKNQFSQPADRKMRWVTFAAAVAAVPLAASAGVTRNWNVANGNWSTAGNWSPSGVPAAGDTIQIFESGVSNIAVNYDYTGTALTLNSLALDDANPVLGATTTLNMSANALTTTNEYLGDTTGSGIGTFNQSGGTNIANTELYLGYNASNTGVYNLSNQGALEANLESIGNEGTGVLTQTNGQNYMGTGALFVGTGTTGVGTYNLSGAGLLTVGGTVEEIGLFGTGSFNQTGGTNTLGTATNLNIGVAAGSVGSYTLSGVGSLSVGDNETIGVNGTGSFVQSGGTNTIAINSILFISQNATSYGSYTLSGGQINAMEAEDIGDGGPALFTQTGGNNTIGDGGFAVGFDSSATYNLSQTGTINAANGEVIGYQGGTSVFNQTGGENTTTSLILAEFAPSAGTYNLSGGSLNVGSNGVTIGFGGVGILNVTGNGVLTSTGPINLMNAGNGSGLNLNGGTINTTALVTNGDPALLNWTSGILNFTTNQVFDPLGIPSSAAFGTQLVLTSGQILEVTGNETLGGTGGFTMVLNSGSEHYVSGNLTINAGSVLTQNVGSTLYAAQITQAGGTINGELQNQGEFIYQGGLFNATLMNQGQVNLGISFTAAGGINNYSDITVNPGQTVIANGNGFDNLGELTLEGGTIGGNVQVINDITGTLFGQGTIDPNLLNLGNVSLSGTLRLLNGLNNQGIVEGDGEIFGSFNNNAGQVLVQSGDLLAIESNWSNGGLINLLGTGGIMAGGTITNTGTLEGIGDVTAIVNNTTGTIRASGGELDLSAAGNSNASGAQIQAPAGGTVMYIQGLASNAGTIALSGGAFDNNNHAITNAATTGFIVGFGTFRSGGLTNNGTVNLSGPSQVYGNVTNNTGGVIHVTGTGVVGFYSPVSNSATATVDTGATAIFYEPYTGNGTVTNNGTVEFTADSISGNISGAGDLVVGTPAAPTSLQITANTGTSAQGELTLPSGSTLDLTTNTFDDNYGTSADPAAAIRSELISGFNSQGAKWTGVGITSSAAAANPNHFAVGYADGGNPKDHANTQIPAGEVEIMYTVAGDANLSGAVDLSDLVIIASDFGMSGADWAEGDLNYDGNVDLSDLVIVASNFGASLSSVSTADFSGSFAAEWQLALAEAHSADVSVPEPCGLLGLGTAGYLTLRRRGAKKMPR